MYEQILVVKYVAAKNCFLHLPSRIHRQYFVKGSCICVKQNGKTFYLTCDPKPLQQSFYDTFDDNVCGLNSMFAKSMDLKEGDAIVCSLISHSGSLKSIHIVPSSDEDWILLESNANKVQNVFMDQVRVVCDKQILTLWCSKTLCIKFEVVNLEPNSPMGYLENDTQVIVLHPEDKINFQKPFDASWTLTDFLKNQFSKKTDNLEPKNDENILQELEILFKKFNIHKYDVYRTIPMKFLQNEILENDYFVGVDKNYLPQNHKPSCVYEMQKVSVCQKYLKKDEGGNSYKLYVKLCTYNFDNLQNHKQTLVCSKALCKTLNLNLGDHVILQPVKELQELEAIELNFGVKYQNYNTFDLIDLFKNYVVQKSTDFKVLIPNKIKLTLSEDYFVEVRLKPEELMYAELNADCFSKTSINAVFENFDTSNDDYKFNEYNFGVDKHCRSIQGFTQIVDECVESISKDFLHQAVAHNIIIEGSEGTGKSSITKSICQRLSQTPFLYHVKILQCKNLKGRRCETVLNEIGSVLYETLQKSPSVLVFDDLEQILKVVEPERDAPDAILMHNRISDMFYNLISLCQKHHQICIIATCQSTRLLNSLIYAARGMHLFSEIYKIPDLDKENRIKLMQHLLKQEAYLEPNLNWSLYSEISEGYVMQDFVDFAQRASFHAWKNKSKSNNSAVAHLLTISDEMVLKALSDTRPIGIMTSDTDTNQQKSLEDLSDTWNSVGGLSEVKEQLLELVKWPSLYPKIFVNAPITLSRGVLLYGPPGCGKTLLGTIIAKYCKLRLIRVRGPELLGKYAGESERQVREVFKRAQSARPCILFFDEFDSLAPRRGHDTSGVSDRVVNQLLTELDGCEARDVTGGVFILAATSRPDLIDPALLRPGRLDPQFLCPIPDTDGRFDILKSLTTFNKKLQLKSDENSAENILQDVAKHSDGFTGADLSALLCKAKEFAMENNNDTISKDNLVEALKNSRPSLSLQERQKYDAIHNRFSNTSLPETGTVVLTKRATMA